MVPLNTALNHGQTVEVIVAVDNWVKVRDVSGDLAWVEKRQLSDKRTVLVKAGTVDIRQAAFARSIGGWRVSAPLIVHKDVAYARGRLLVDKMRKLIPRQMFEVVIQARLTGHLLSEYNIPLPFKKDRLFYSFIRLFYLKFCRWNAEKIAKNTSFSSRR